MNSDKREQLFERILSSENLQNLLTIRDNRNLIDQNLLKESEKFVSLDRQSIKPKEEHLESTEQIDLNVKKFNELDEQLKKFIKNVKKQFKQTPQHCDQHQKFNKTPFSISINEFIQNDLSVPEVDSVIERDEITIQQHACNIDKIDKVMEMVKKFNYKEATLPVIEEINASILLLREVNKN